MGAPLEYLHPDARVLPLSALGKEDIARAIGELAGEIETWRRKGRAWSARPSLVRSNKAIAEDFSRILLDARSRAA